ncbi:hypothetical protein BFP70_03000 [Thioclava sp. SK-1]|nr:hypothetical protein BFP70_03000 [Thioclava sp. SK-1]
MAIGAFLASAVGLMPWLEIAARFGENTVPYAGAWLQGGAAALGLILALYLPAHERVARLERSHRSFHLGMKDVAHAYRIAHESDRRGVFTLSGEFDAMRERLTHLRKHPDLAGLEPELLELATQMSLQSRELSAVYSDQHVTRAREFLAHRQAEAERVNDQISAARRTCAELRHWLTDVETEERLVAQQYRMLERDLEEILPGLGYEMEEIAPPPGPDNVVALPQAGTAKSQVSTAKPRSAAKRASDDGDPA